MDAQLQRLCVEVCDKDVATARAATQSLTSCIDGLTPAELTPAFDFILAPVFARLGELSVPAALSEDLLTALALLLERTEPRDLKLARAQRVFPMAMERVLLVLEDMPAGDKEHLSVSALRCAEAALDRWYRLCDRGAEVVHLQLGFLTHIVVQFIQASQRALCLQCVLLLRMIALVEDDADKLACFYPGVCTVLVKLLLHGDFKLGAKVLAAACDAWQEWIKRVLADTANSVHIRSSPLSLANLFRDYNRDVAGQDKEVQARCESSAQEKLAGQRSGTRLKLERNSEWLAETTKNTSEAVVMVLRVPQGPVAAVWREKAKVRHSFLELSIAILEHCRGTLAGGPLDGAFDAVLSALSDSDDRNRLLAKDFLRRYTIDSSDAQMQKWVVERLIEAIKAIPPAGRQLDDKVTLQQRIANADGFLCFLRERSASNSRSSHVCQLPAHHAELLYKPLLQVCALDAQSLRPIFEDTRSLVSLPVSGISTAESFVAHFPYGYGLDDGDQLQVGAEVEAHVGNRGALRQSSHTVEAQQVHHWLHRSLRLADGDSSLASRLMDVIAHMLGVFTVETLFSLVFDDPMCKWSTQADTTVAGTGPFPLSCEKPKEQSETLATSSLLHRASAMYAMATWFDAACNESKEISRWVPRHCISLVLSSMTDRAGGSAAGSLHDLCAVQLLSSSLSAVYKAEARGAGRAGVHAQVKHILMPLLEKLGSASLVGSTAAMSVLVQMHSLLELPTTAGTGPVQVLLAEYADYLVGDICFQLKFGSVAQGEDERELRGGLPAVLMAVMQHVGFEMVPFLSDVVNTLLHSSPHSVGEQWLSVRRKSGGWVLRILAGVLRQLAQLICQRRIACQGQPLLEDSGATSEHSQEDHLCAKSSGPSCLTAFLIGTRREWKAEQRHNGFFPKDLTHCFNEDPAPSTQDEESLKPTSQSSKYDAERQIATSILLWARQHVQATCATTRHLAHVTVFHAFTVLSTRVKDLLPRVHDVWPALVQSFAEEQPLAVLADACILLKHIARLSGDFMRERFAKDCWPGMWTHLRDYPVADTAESSARSPKFKAQLATLDALAFLAGDPAVVRGVADNLIVIGLKFVASESAEPLRDKASMLLHAVAAEDPDLLWIYLQGSSHAVNIELPLLSEARVPAVSEETMQGIVKLLEDQSRAMAPRISVSVAGRLWSTFLHPESVC